MSYQVFISYSSRDKNLADAICNHLENAKIRCWIAPRDIKPGVEWASAILEGISSCKILLLVFTGQSDASPQVLREVERAVSKGLTIIPVRIENILPTEGMEYYLSAVHWLDAFIPPHERYFTEIEDKIKLFLEGQTAIKSRNTDVRKSSGRYLSSGEISSTGSASLKLKTDIFDNAPLIFFERNTQLIAMTSCELEEDKVIYETKSDELNDGEFLVSNFAFTSNLFKFNSTLNFRNSAIARDFGCNASHADFEHVRKYSQFLGVPQFIDLLKLRDVTNPDIPAYDGVEYWNQGPFVTYKGAVSEGSRAFFISVHDGVMLDDWRIIDTIEGHNIDLGSWHNNRKVLVFITRRCRLSRNNDTLQIELIDQ